MGTTLTGTTPQDTYDSLIKVTNNGPLSSTARYLSDGLGNDSVLALSTARVGIGTATPQGPLEVKGDTDYDSPKSIVITHAEPTVYSGFIGLRQEGLANSVMAFGTRSASVDYLDTLSLSNGKVGIGTSAPSDKLHVSGSGNTATFITGSGCTTYIQSVTNETRIGNLTSGGGSIVFSPSDAERVRITSNGLTFNGDTAAANALDDYEEGTFTPTYAGATYSGATSNVGRYTKIGRLVHFDIFLYDAIFSSSSGPATIGGLPFTANTQVYGQGLITYNTAVDGNTNGGYVDAGSTNFFPVDENSTSVSSFINGTVSLMVSGTYTV